MSFHKVTLLSVILTLLSGTFSLQRIPNLDVNLEIRFVFIFILLLCLIMSINGSKIGYQSNIIPKNMKIFLGINYIFAILLSLSAMYSEDKKLSFLGVIDILVIILIIGISIYSLVSIVQKDLIKYISLIWILIGILYFIPIILSVINGDMRGQSISGPNVSTRILFFATCCAIYSWLTQNKKTYLLISLMFIAGIILLGSRGGVVGALVTLLILLVIQKFSNLKKVRISFGINFRMVAIFASLLSIVFIFGSSLKKVINERIIGVTFRSTGEIYTSGRDTIYSDALTMIKESPLIGYGINSFGYYSNYGYPHNLLLELMLDIGFLGLIYFIILLFYSIRIIIDFRNSPLYVLSGIPLYMIVVQMFSGGLYDFRYYFFWILILFYYQQTSVFLEIKSKRIV
ncbi:O-antigen ligase family protein [Alkalihalobacillus macyae]|uniref:O-antigen ligase family protein n=1 Tax=Guptibacillus hwajinpoensis TaxID=208199 RepID=UPI00273C5E12|nr:O-antigen ligase family protein [Alkalihalobacillus macyae]MDP4551663.1 O-antigen ligase family protein [Alkalihalobacillus macyae]